MKKLWTVCLGALFVLACAEDATQKKRANNTQQNQNQQQNPNSLEGNQQPQQSQEGSEISYGDADNCGVKTFTKNLTGSLQKNILVFGKISGDGLLAVENTLNSLKLDVGVQNLSITPTFFVDQGNAEVDKITGVRTFTKVSDSELAALKNQGAAWTSTNCSLGFAKQQMFPFGQGKMVTVEFSPALPFAPYPDKVDESLESAVGDGLNFSGITGKIIEITGGPIQGFAVGDEYEGAVELTRSGTTYKTAFNFGSASALEKLGLFNFAAYTYSQGDISSVEVKAPILNGTDSVQITFD